MNKIKIILLTISIALCLVSCIKDDRNNYLPEESVWLLESSLREVDPSVGSFSVILIKSGKGLSSCDVGIKVDDALLSEYNALNGTALAPLPENVFTLSESSVHFDKGDFRKEVIVLWEPAALSALLKIGEYAIPLSLECRGLETDKEKSTIIIKPVI